MSDFKLSNEATRAVDYKQLRVSSTAFEHEQMIPRKYTCDGINISPPLDIEHIPEAAKSLALVVDDPDATTGMWVHWLVWDMPVTHHIKENEVHGIEGINDFQQQWYGDPCPALDTHRYFFKIYALDALLNLPVTTKKIELEKAMSGHIIGFGELIGWYKKQK
jgi:Raf kinase inhibitor-like YbhB/YbcL family protein